MLKTTKIKITIETFKNNIMRFCVLFAFFALLNLYSAVAQKQGYDIGDKFEDFTAIDENGKEWDASKLIGKKNIVIYFYPAAMTGGCTKQACAYRDDLKSLDSLNAIVVGISGDSPENLALFKEAYKLNFTLLSDPEGKIALQFGVPVKEEEKSIVRAVAGIEHVLVRKATTARWTFVFNEKGTLIYKSSDVIAAQDSKSVINALKGTIKSSKKTP
ncbi:peroxiredoxin [Labilibacter sediminis]|nr:peroxiredoxin [Labilibacter sediminis]